MVCVPVCVPALTIRRICYFYIYWYTPNDGILSFAWGSSLINVLVLVFVVFPSEFVLAHLIYTLTVLLPPVCCLIVVVYQ